MLTTMRFGTADRRNATMTSQDEMQRRRNSAQQITQGTFTATNSAELAVPDQSN